MQENVNVPAEATMPAEGEVDTNAAVADEGARAVAKDTTDGEVLGKAVEDTTPAATTEIPLDSNPITIPIKFNHERRELTVEEATTWAQKGMFHEKVIDDLRELAGNQGLELQEFVSRLKRADDDFLMERLMEEAGGNKEVAQKLMELERFKRKSAFDQRMQNEQQAEQNERQALSDRLAAEFVELQAEFPDVAEFKKLPQEVVNMAIDKNIHLQDAYARHLRAQARKVSDNQQQNKKTEAAAIGSIGDNPNTGTDTTIQAMLDGLASVL